MSDVVAPAVRSRMMSGIRGKHTKPEILVRKALHAAGYRFRLHRKDLPGAPDVVLPGRKVAIFAHGCFWHMHAGCKNARMPTTRPDFWRQKLQANVDRDRRAVEDLRSMGWRVLIVWECGTRDPAIIANLPTFLSAWIEGYDAVGVISAATS
jgi:DNA mismatch endonuclease, patch repair protein